MRRLVIVIALAVLPGCIARTAADIVTAPVKAGAQATDWATTSQDEADRGRGREMRKQEKRARKACKKERGTDC